MSEVMIDMMQKMLRLEILELSRQAGQVTLDQLVKVLEKAVKEDDRIPIRFSDGTLPGEFMSYRGYYYMLSLSRGGIKYAETLLLMAKGALGYPFTGYKGGQYLMEEHTPVWVSEYGECSGEGIVGIEAENWEVVLVLGRIEEEI